ncbi:hypothetical protein GCM10009566_71360 [Streptomyces murinus]
MVGRLVAVGEVGQAAVEREASAEMSGHLDPDSGHVGHAPPGVGHFGTPLELNCRRVQLAAICAVTTVVGDRSGGGSPAVDGCSNGETGKGPRWVTVAAWI